MKIRKLLIFGVALTLATLGILFALLYATIQKQESLYLSQVERYQSYLLADELRQSSDDLTRLARTYVLTGDDKYEKMYWDILAIRNGDKPRPLHMERIYWDLVLNYGQKPSPDGSQVSLQALMEQAGFTEQEFSRLTAAQQNSDGLVTTETIAMNAVKGLYADSKGGYTIRKAPDLEMAKNVMHDEQYHANKAKIMKPVNEFLTLLDERTSRQVEQNKEEVRWFENLLLTCFIGAFIAISLSLYFISRTIMFQMGGEPTDVLASMKKISDGQLNYTPTPTRYSNHGLSIGLVEMAGNLSSTINEVKRSSQELAHAAEEMSTVSEQSNNSVVQQLKDVEQVAAAMTQMSSSVTEVAESASKTSSSVQNATSQVEQVNSTVAQVIQNVHKLSQEVDSISSVVTQLSLETNNIDSVLGVIGDIADQTNLLALNAAIEAARAGEQGRGFAVVADEVRTLASRTQTSTAEIQEIISSLQNGANQATLAMEKGLERVETTVEGIEAVGGNLQEIAISVTEINDKSLLISQASNEQSSVAEEVNRNLQRISQVANEASNNSSKVAQASNTLANLSVDLNRMVDKFTTKRN